MKQSRTIPIPTLICLAWLGHATAGMAEDEPPTVKVGVYARHMASKIVYNYRVINKFPQTIDAITIGRDSKNDEDPNNDTWELVELPSDWHSKLGIPAANSSSPTGWKVSVSDPEKGDTHAILWEVINDKSPPLLGGQTLAKMSISLDQADANYLTGHAMVHFTNRYPATITVPIEQLDTTPPTLEVTLKPDTIFPPDNKLVPVNVFFTVKEDDYDRLPEIKLESITANEPLEPDDIRDASFGIDDRYIKLRAHRNGWTDRIYTVIYSATDASGNQTLASAAVTVPHDRGGNMNP
ncbi:MAG: hypothetical protein ACOY9D_01515 [Pseudomonadota bacterium]